MGIRSVQELAERKGNGTGMVPHLLPFLIFGAAFSGVLMNPFCTADAVCHFKCETF